MLPRVPRKIDGIKIGGGGGGNNKDSLTKLVWEWHSPIFILVMYYVDLPVGTLVCSLHRAYNYIVYTSLYTTYIYVSHLGDLLRETEIWDINGMNE